MRVTIDSRAGAAYLYLVKRDEFRVKNTISANSNIQIDLDEDGRIIGIELLDLDILPAELIGGAQFIDKR